MRLNRAQIRQYFDDGFLLVEDVFTDKDLQPVLNDFEVLVDEWTDKLYKGGKIKNIYKDEDVYTRLASIEREWPNAAALIASRMGMRPTLVNLWCSKKLLDTAEQFLGTDIVGHPTSVIRTKTPRTALMTVPWHQDAAYFAEVSEVIPLQPTAWIPFVDTTVKNGTLQLMPGSHRSREIFPHHLERDVGHKKSWYLYIAEDDLPSGNQVTCDVKKGSILWHGNLMVHRSTENYSDKIRWSCDLRYQRPNEPTGFPAEMKLPPMRKANDPSFRLDWEHWSAQQSFDQSIEKYRELQDDEFDFSAPGASWLTRWQKYWEAQT